LKKLKENIPYKLREQVIFEIYKDFNLTFNGYFENPDSKITTATIMWINEKLSPIHLI
jgi:hypothetical protein